MKDLIEVLEVNDWLKLNAQLQQKKNALRTELEAQGIQKKDKKNEFDHYAYFSEAGYKELFTKLFSKFRLELTSSEIGNTIFETGNEKQPTGRQVNVQFVLTDIDTGFYEIATYSGEGIDKGDKAIYKAYTGAIKYYLANTFMVATGDDPETESPEAKPKAKQAYNPDKKVSPKQVTNLLKYYQGAELERLLTDNNITKIEDLPMQVGTNLLGAIWNVNSNKETY